MTHPKCNRRKALNSREKNRGAHGGFNREQGHGQGSHYEDWAGITAHSRGTWGAEMRAIPASEPFITPATKRAERAGGGQGPRHPHLPQHPSHRRDPRPPSSHDSCPKSEFQRRLQLREGPPPPAPRGSSPRFPLKRLLEPSLRTRTPAPSSRDTHAPRKRNRGCWGGTGETGRIFPPLNPIAVGRGVRAAPGTPLVPPAPEDRGLGPGAAAAARWCWEPAAPVRSPFGNRAGGAGRETTPEGGYNQESFINKIRLTKPELIHPPRSPPSRCSGRGAPRSCPPPPLFAAAPGVTTGVLPPSSPRWEAAAWDGEGMEGGWGGRCRRGFARPPQPEK